MTLLILDILRQLKAHIPGYVLQNGQRRHEGGIELIDRGKHEGLHGRFELALSMRPAPASGAGGIVLGRQYWNPGWSCGWGFSG